MGSKVFFFIIAVLLVVGFFITPHYGQWLVGNIMNPPISYSLQFSNLEPEQRLSMRYGPTYTVYEKLKTALANRNAGAHPVILLPPPGYLQQMGVLNIKIGTPPEFYYFTGYEGVFAGSPNVERAEWALVPGKNGVGLKHLKKEDREELQKRYNQFQSAR